MDSPSFLGGEIGEGISESGRKLPVTQRRKRMESEGERGRSNRILETSSTERREGSVHTSRTVGIFGIEGPFSGKNPKKG